MTRTTAAMMRDTSAGRAGDRFELRPIEESDYPLLSSFARRLSFRTRYFRHGRGSFEMGEDDIRQMCSPDPASSVHLVVPTHVGASWIYRVGISARSCRETRSANAVALSATHSVVTRFWRRHDVSDHFQSA